MKTQKDLDNHANQLNPTHITYWKSRVQQPTKRKKVQSKKIVLPKGTFRNIKRIVLSLNGRDVYFDFSIKNIYGSYRIYIKRFPNKSHYGQSCSHEAHMYYDYDEECHYICWDEEITSFPNANAIMFVWAKNYLKNCMAKYKSSRHVPHLPIGTFRMK